MENVIIYCYLAHYIKMCTSLERKYNYASTRSGKRLQTSRTVMLFVDEDLTELIVARLEF